MSDFQTAPLLTPVFNSVPPEMYITTTPRAPGIPDIHELKGWEELDTWGHCHHSHWRAIQQRLSWADGMSEIDKLRMLAGEMLRQNVELMKQNHQQAMLAATRYVLPSSTCVI